MSENPPNHVTDFICHKCKRTFGHAIGRRPYEQDDAQDDHNDYGCDGTVVPFYIKED